jgi:hypothetical protein
VAPPNLCERADPSALAFRLKGKVEGSTRLVYTGLCGGLEHLKIETRLRLLRVERFESVKCECVI